MHMNMFRLLKSNHVFSSLMTLHRILNIGNMTGMRSSSSFNMGHVAKYLVSVLGGHYLFLSKRLFFLLDNASSSIFFFRSHLCYLQTFIFGCVLEEIAEQLQNNQARIKIILREMPDIQKEKGRSL